MQLIDVTGFIALALNVHGLVGKNDRTLRATNGIACGLWALNNALLSAFSAAALLAISAGRQAGAEAVQNRSARTKFLTFAFIIALTIGAAALTWNGSVTISTTLGALIAAWGMFYLRGTALRLSMVLVSALFMHNAMVYASLWQAIANIVCGAGGLYGAWRSRREDLAAATA